MNRNFYQLIASIVLFTGITLLAGCGSREVKTPPDKVTVQLKWVHQAQFAGLYMAQEKGYYAEENIKVTLIEGGPGIDTAEQVVTKKADFGVEQADRLIQSAGQGESVTVFAVIYRRNALAFVSLADSRIERPVDLLGRTIAIGLDGKLQLQAMMKRLGLDINDVNLVPYSYDYTPLYNRKVDITTAHSTGGLIRIRRAGRQVNVIWPSDYDVHFYADSLFTSHQMIAENPDLVTRFLRATLRGWREAVEEPKEAVAITLKYAKEGDADLQALMMEASLPLIHTGEDHIGWIQAGVVKEMHQILLEERIIAEPVELDRLFTMQFLGKIYGQQN